MPPLPYEGKALVDFALLFATGAFLSSIGLGQNRYRHIIAVSALAVSVVVIIAGQYSNIQFILYPLLVISFGSCSTFPIAGLNKSMGDFSYGIYLYGFPVQQTLLRFYKLTPLQVIATADPITLVLGALSWFLIEKKALGIKRRHIKESHWLLSEHLSEGQSLSNLASSNNSFCL